MDATHITAFVNAAQGVFQTMLQLPVEIGTPQYKQSEQSGYDVSGIIGMSGGVEGAVILSFPTTTAERVVSLFTGETISCEHEDFADAVGELVNMISGSAKAQFDGEPVNISCPSVVMGHDHIVIGRKDAVRIVIPCSSDCGQFALEVAIRTLAGAAGQSHHSHTAGAAEA